MSEFGRYVVDSGVIPRPVWDLCQQPPCPFKDPIEQDGEWRMRVREHFASGAHSQTRRDAAALVRMMETELRRATEAEGE